MLLVASFAVVLIMVAMGAASDGLSLMALSLLLAVAAGAALKPELGKERYAGVIDRVGQRLSWLGGHVRRRGQMALLGGVAGFVVGGLMLGWWWDLGMPVQCQDLFFPDPPLCDVLLFIRGRIFPFFIAVGVILGWRSRRRLDRSRTPRSSRTSFEVLGQLVALASLILGVIIVAPIALDLPGYQQDPWLGLVVGSTAISGGVLYTLGMRHWTGRRAVASRAMGWMMFTGVLLVPLLVSTYLVRWWLQGALLAAMASPAIPAWGRLSEPVSSSQ